MGWLEDELKEMEFKSLRDLAFTMEKDSRWPKNEKHKAETIANRLRDLDKGKSVEWWFSTGKDYLPVLAATLDESQHELEELIRGRTAQVGGEHIWVFDVFPPLRPLDLQNEDPFPGIPKELLSYGGPKEQLTYWYAPRGAGKTLLGRWLSLRYGWVHVSGESWSEIELPKSGKVFVELESVKDVPWKELTQSANQKLVIASPERRDHSNESNREVVLTDVVSPISAEWLEELMDWTSARLPSSESFDKASTLELLQVSMFHFESPGDLLSFLGAVNEVGVKVFREGPVKRIINTWAKAVVARHVRKCPVGVDEVLAKQAYEILSQMEMTRLLRGLPGRLSLEQWTELIPETIAPPIERERLLGIVQSDDEESAAKLKQIRIALDPDAEAIAKGLTVIGVLSSVGSSWMGPAWVRSYIHWDVFETLFKDGNVSLGSLLLHEETSEDALRELIDTLHEGKFEVAKKCIKGPFDTPESLAALDGVFRAVGLARLGGASISEELVQAVWEAQLAHVHFAPREGLPLPWFRLTGAKYDATLTTRHAWIASALSLGFTLTEEQRIRCPEQIDPRNKHNDVWGWLTPVDVRFDPSPELNGFLYKLGGEYYEQVGKISLYDGLLPIQGPDVLVAYLAGRENELPKEEVEKLLEFPFGWSAFEDACLRQGQDLDEMIKRCWEYWGDGRSYWPPFDHRVLNGDASERIWRLARGEYLSQRVLKVLTSMNIESEWLDESVWRAWLEDWRTGHAFDEGLEVFRLMPEDLVVQAIRNGWIGSHDRKIHDLVWSRFPQRLLKLLHELSETKWDSEAQSPIIDLLYSVPEPLVVDIINTAKKWLAAPDQFPGIAPHAIRWLSSVIDWRRPGWRAAFELVRARMKE